MGDRALAQCLQVVSTLEHRHHAPGGVLAGVEFQERLESRAYELGGRDYCAPAQLVGDFIAGRPSREVGHVPPSYKPGITWGDLHQALPAFAAAHPYRQQEQAA